MPHDANRLDGASGDLPLIHKSHNIVVARPCVDVEKSSSRTTRKILLLKSRLTLLQRLNNFLYFKVAGWKPSPVYEGVFRKFLDESEIPFPRSVKCVKPTANKRT